MDYTGLFPLLNSDSGIVKGYVKVIFCLLGAVWFLYRCLSDIVTARAFLIRGPISRPPILNGRLDGHHLEGRGALTEVGTFAGGDAVRSAATKNIKT